MKLIRKMQTAAGGPIGLTAKDVNEASKLVAKGFNWIMGKVGEGFTELLSSAAVPTGSATGANTYTNSSAYRYNVNRVKPAAKKAIEKAGPYISPSSHVAAWTQGSLNPEVGALFLASDPRLQSLGIVGDLFTLKYGPKIIKSTPVVVDKGLAATGNKTAKVRTISREIEKNIKNSTPKFSNRSISVKRSNNDVTNLPDLVYTLYNLFGEPIGQTNIGGAVFGSGNKSHRMVDGVMSMRKAHKVSEDTYNAAVLDIIDSGGEGLESGWSLMMPLKTLAVTSKFPHKVIGLEFGNPVRLLTGTSERPLPLRVSGNHFIEVKPQYEIKYNEVTGNFEKVPIQTETLIPSTSLKFFERKPSRISEAERLGVPKGERNQLLNTGYLGEIQKIIGLNNIATMGENSTYLRRLGIQYLGDTYEKPTGELYTVEDSFGKTLKERTKTIKSFSPEDEYLPTRYEANKIGLKKLKKPLNINLFLEKLPKEVYDYLEQIKTIIPNKAFLNQTNKLIPISPTQTVSSSQITPFIIKLWRGKMEELGYYTGDISDYLISLLLTDLYNTLTKLMTGKTKGSIFWHGTPEGYRDFFDFTHTGENTGNIGAMGPGNYFSTGYSYYGDYAEPFLINNITLTPFGDAVAVEKGLIPEFISPGNQGFAEQVAKALKNPNSSIDYYIPEQVQSYADYIRKLLKNTPTEKSRMWIGNGGNRPELTTEGFIPKEVMIRRNTGIKSLFPHPDLFVRDNSGKVILNRNWNDIRVNYKQGGKMNILQFLKNGSGIHIKKENKGKFTDYCGGKVTSSCIARGKASSDPAVRKRATFAANARKWKHKNGGTILKFQLGGPGYFTSLKEPEYINSSDVRAGLNPNYRSYAHSINKYNKFDPSIEDPDLRAEKGITEAYDSAKNSLGNWYLSDEYKLRLDRARSNTWIPNIMLSSNLDIVNNLTNRLNSASLDFDHGEHRDDVSYNAVTDYNNNKIYFNKDLYKYVKSLPGNIFGTSTHELSHWTDVVLPQFVLDNNRRLIKLKPNLSKEVMLNYGRPTEVRARAEDIIMNYNLSTGYKSLNDFVDKNKDKIPALKLLINIFDSEESVLNYLNNFAGNSKDMTYYVKRGGKAFVKGVNVLDSNPDAYKYVKKKYKMRSALQGAKFDWGLLASTGASLLNSYLSTASNKKETDSNYLTQIASLELERSLKSKNIPYYALMIASKMQKDIDPENPNAYAGVPVQILPYKIADYLLSQNDKEYNDKIKALEMRSQLLKDLSNTNFWMGAAQEGLGFLMNNIGKGTSNTSSNSTNLSSGITPLTNSSINMNNYYNNMGIDSSILGNYLLSKPTFNYTTAKVLNLT